MAEIQHTMPPEVSSHLLIGTNDSDMVEFDKVTVDNPVPEAVAPESTNYDEPQEQPSTPENESAKGTRESTSSSKHEQSDPAKSNKYIYRVEYTDNTGTVVAIKKGKVPIQDHISEADGDIPVFELIKRVKVLAKAGKDLDKKNKQDKSPGQEETAEDSGKKNKEPKEKAGALKDLEQESAEEKLKGFDISPDSSTTWILKIISEYLMNAMRAVVEYYPGLELLSNTVEFDEPYRELIHHMDKLEVYKDNQPENHPHEYRAICKEHVEELLTYLKKTFAEKLKEEYARHQREIPICTFPYLWLLYRPGEEVYWQYNNTKSSPDSSFIVNKVSGGVSTPNSRSTPLRIELFGIWYNGDVIGREIYEKVIQPFDGEKSIRELKLYPPHFYQEDPKATDKLPLNEQFIRNGKTYFELCKPGRGHYRVAHGKPLGIHRKDIIQGRVVVDFNKYYEDMDERRIIRPNYNSDSDDSDDEDDSTARTGCRCIHCTKKPSQKKGLDWTKYDNINPAEPPKFDDDLVYRLCYIRVPALVLKERKWELVHVSDLREVTFNEDMLGSLVLPSEVKSTVQALAWNSSRKIESSFNADFIEGKGDGQILLLHGSPGVGKTATAECVAELVKRPLIALTCGHLGTNVAEVEKTLKKYLSWGVAWGAVILLDEADVYLESRRTGEVERNALVSVFLRELEYYKGLMFLTTNRIGTFDDAFISRVHVGLFYKALEDRDREQIWMNLFGRLESETTDPPVTIHSDAEQYVTGGWKKNGKIQEDLIAIGWNGREIRNAFQTALALASYMTNGKKKDGERLSPVVLRADHIQDVVKMSERFKAFVNRTKTGTEDSRARDEQLRASSTEFVGRESSFSGGTPTRKR